MGTTLVVVFFAFITAAVVQSTLRRKRNPYGEVAFEGLPDALRSEIDRVLPGFQQRLARLTRNGDEARVEGDYLGESMRIEADFDGQGALVELEVEGRRGTRTQGRARPEDLPDAASREIERVLGEAHAGFEPRVVLHGTSDGEPHYEVKGLAGDWKWEIAVTASGRLLEVEKERRRH